jgi:hypothetical protein
MFLFIIDDIGIPFDNSLLLQKASRISGNGIFVRVAGVVPILNIFFILRALVVVDFLNSCFIEL